MSRAGIQRHSNRRISHSVEERVIGLCGFIGYGSHHFLRKWMLVFTICLCLSISLTSVALMHRLDVFKYLKITQEYQDIFGQEMGLDMRKKLIAEACASSKEQTHAAQKQMYVMESYNIMVCVIPKCGSQFWTYYFQRLCQLKPDECTLGQEMKKLSDYSFEDQNNILKTYHKVMFVRHPFDRLWSAYGSKFQNQNPYFNWRYGKYIVDNFRTNKKKGSAVCGDDVTFDEFLRYVLAVHAMNIKVNEHWMRYQDICDPCHINYDFIGSLETFDSDFREFESSLKLPQEGADMYKIYRGSLNEKIVAAQTTHFFDETKIIKSAKTSLHMNCSKNAKAFLQGNWRSLANQGFISATDMLDLEGLGFNPSDNSSWKEFRRKLVDVQAKKLTDGRTEDEAIELIQKRKKSLQYDAFSQLDSNLVARLKTLFEKDFNMFGYT